MLLALAISTSLFERQFSRTWFYMILYEFQSWFIILEKLRNLLRLQNPLYASLPETKFPLVNQETYHANARSLFLKNPETTFWLESFWK